MTAIERVIATARAEIGYIEKATNSQLEGKTANAGTSRLRSPTTSVVGSPLRQPRQTTSGPTRITTAVSTAPPSECRPAQ